MSNDMQSVRNALTNFIGALALAIPLEPRFVKQEIAAVLMEEVLKLSQDENGVYELFTLKPLFRAQIAILKQRVSELQTLPAAVAKDQISRYEEMISEYERLVNGLK